MITEAEVQKSVRDAAEHAFSGRAVLARMPKGRDERAAELKAARKLARAVKQERRASDAQSPKQQRD